MKKATKKLKRDIQRKIRKIKTNNSLEKIIKAKFTIDNYYNDNSNIIDTETLIDFYDYYNSDKEANFQFFFCLITTIIFSFIYDFIMNVKLANDFNALIKEEINMNKSFSLKAISIFAIVLFMLILIFIICWCIKIYHSNIINLSRRHNSYKTRTINVYHKDKLLEIIESRQKIEQNRVEYEMQNELHLDNRIEVYAIERID